MAIRFVQLDPGAPAPAEAEPDAPAVEPAAAPPEGGHGSEAAPGAADPPARRARRRADAAPAAEPNLLAEPPSPAEPKPRLRRKPAAEAAPAPAGDDPAPMLFPDLPLQPRPDRKARRNRRGFG